MSSNNHVFVSYKALGFVTNEVPICVGYYRKMKKPYVITCIGRAFHVYNCNKLAIVNISDSLPEAITCIQSDSQFIYVASGRLIYIFVQWKKVWKILDSHEHKVNLLLPFADHLVSIDDSSCMKVWTIKDANLFSEMDLGAESFKATAVMHPHEYVNKILVGSEQGSMRLINLSQNKTIYSFDGWKSPVMALAQSQAVNVVGVGLKDGRIILHDLKFDETLMTFLQEWGPVTSLSFRSDRNNLLVAGSAMGHIGVWDLENRKLLSQLNEAHYGPVTGLCCLQSEPVMLTTSSDNTLKTWIFDLSDGGARLLHQRSGHSKPPTKVRFHGATGNTILSAGLDSTLRSFSTIHDSSNKSLGRASYNKKQSKKKGLKADNLIMPPITDFCSEISRQSDWDGVLACHDGEYLSTTWNYNRSCMGQHKFKLEEMECHVHPAKKVVATCVTITSCGNFGLIGYSNGCVNTFNLQSGLYRGSYVDEKLDAAHACSVSGVFVDEVNHFAVTVALETLVKFWNFQTKSLAGRLELDAVPMRGVLHRENNLLALALSDFSVATVDVETRRVVRKFEGHDNDITDMAFCRQGRWLVTSSMDCCIRVFDLFSTILVDVFQVHSPATSISVSPTDELLATTHTNDLGIYLWYNRALHVSESLCISAPTQEAATRPDIVPLPETKCSAEDAEGERPALEVADESDIYASPHSIGGLLSCSDLSEARWLALLNYDITRKKNTLKAEKVVDAKVPFFIPTKPGLVFSFDLLQAEQTPEDDADIQKKVNRVGRNLGDILKEAHMGNEEKLFVQAREYILSLSTSMIECEIRGLEDTFLGNSDILDKFLQFLKFWVKSNTQIDLFNAILNRFIKMYHDNIVREHGDTLKEIIEALEEKANTFSNSKDLISFVVSYQRNSTL